MENALLYQRHNSPHPYGTERKRAIIQVASLTKYYGSKAALNGVSFDVARGGVVGLLGLNGAGKSTAMGIITGYLGATSGRVLIDGLDISKEPIKAKAKIGYLPENPPLYLDMNVDETLRFAYGLKKLKLDRQKHMNEICELTGVAHGRGRLVKNLSKGYRQRVGLAQALMGFPEALILDEPTVGLDPTQIVEIRSLIRQVGKSSTVILSSHILPEIQAVCERILVLHKGSLVADYSKEALSSAMRPYGGYIISVDGDPETVLGALRGARGVREATRLTTGESGAHDYRVDGEGDGVRQAVFYALAEARCPILSLRGSERTLEDVFLRLTVGDESSGLDMTRDGGTELA